MLLLRLQRHQVDDIDEAHLQFRQVAAQQVDGGERLQRRHVARRRQDDVGLAVVVIAGPFPDADAGRAVLDRRVHAEPLQLRLLAGDDDVDEIARTQALVGDAQQGVGVRRQIDADDVRLLVHDMVDEAGVLVREAVVVLAPDMRGEQDVERGDGAPPGDFVAHLEPFRVLVEHRVDDVDEGLVAGEEAMAAGQQVAFQPALAGVLGEDLHDAAFGAEVVVFVGPLGHPGALRHLEEGAEAVRGRLVRPDDAEIARGGIQPHHIAQESPHDARRFAVARAGRGNRQRVVAEVRQREVAHQQPAVGMRVGAHAPRAHGGKFAQVRARAAVGLEQFLGAVAFQPVLEQAQVGRIARHVGERHLVRAPRTLRPASVDGLRPGPALGRAQHDHRPARAHRLAACACRLADGGDLGHHLVERDGHGLVHRFGLLALDEARRVAVAEEQAFQFRARDAREDRRVGDLVAVQVQDRQHGAVAGRIEELVRMPGGGQRAGLRLAVADDAGDDQLRVVEGGAEGMRQGVAQFAALMDGAGRLRRDVAADAARIGELLEQALHAGGVLRHAGVELAVGAFEPGIGDQRRAAVARAGDEDHVQVVRLDHAVQVQVDEVQPGRRAPVAEQPRLDVLDAQRLGQQRIVEQVDLADGEVVRGAPVGVHAREFVRFQGVCRLPPGSVHHASLLSRWNRVRVASPGTRGTPAQLYDSIRVRVFRTNQAVLDGRGKSVPVTRRDE